MVKRARCGLLELRRLRHQPPTTTLTLHTTSTPGIEMAVRSAYGLHHPRKPLRQGSIVGWSVAVHAGKIWAPERTLSHHHGRSTVQSQVTTPWMRIMDTGAYSQHWLVLLRVRSSLSMIRLHCGRRLLRGLGGHLSRRGRPPHREPGLHSPAHHLVSDHNHGRGQKRILWLQTPQRTYG